MAQPKIVIVTRTKNRNLLLKRALDSVSAQTYKDYIHVIVNDGGSKEEVDKLLEGYTHSIKVIHNTKSIGLTQALNQGIKSVETKYISILDDDDSWHPDRLKKTVQHLEESGAKGVVCVMDRIVEEIDGDEVKEILRDRIHEGTSSISLYRQCLDNYFTNGCFTYQRSVYDELGGYDEKLIVAEDWDFGIRFLLKYDADFLNTKDALHNYHHRPEAKGDVGNSVFDRADEHRRHVNILANHYLRKDMQQGKFGVGYIMNSLLYRREFIVPYEENRLQNQTSHIEHHINEASVRLQHELTNKMMARLKVALKNRINPFRKSR